MNGRSISLLATSLVCALLAACSPRESNLAALERLEPCHLPGVEREARCGHLDVAENPDTPDGKTISIGFAVVPATATHKTLDAIFVLAGGPGQSSISIAGQAWPIFEELGSRRDIVFIDQRGTGRSNALDCAQPGRRLPLAESIDVRRQLERIAACQKELSKRADLAQYATWIAVRDFDRVRAALGYPTINLWGGSYGTRAALEYARQYPQQVRALVLDGVAPADAALPVSFARDIDSAWQLLARECAADARCVAAHPDLLAEIDAQLSAANKAAPISVADPYFGSATQVTVDRTIAAQLMRGPMYVPSLSAALPYAIGRASEGDFAPLIGLNAVLGESIEGEGFAEGMHFSVICAEDLSRPEAVDRNAVASTRIRDVFIDQYERVCSTWPKRAVPPEFFAAPKVAAPVLLLSGGRDPVTPHSNAKRIADALPRATSLVAPHLAHLISFHGCTASLMRRFIREGDAKNLDAACLQRIPAPWFFVPPHASGQPSTATLEAHR